MVSASAAILRTLNCLRIMPGRPRAIEDCPVNHSLTAFARPRQETQAGSRRAPSLNAVASAIVITGITT